MHPKIQKIQKLISQGLEPKIDIINHFELEEDAYAFEAWLISDIGSNFIESIKDGPLTNLTPGGHGGGSSTLWTEEKRKVMSDKMKGINAGEKNGMFGKIGQRNGIKVERDTLEKMGKTVYQYSIEGIYINKFHIMKEVAKDVGICEPTLRKAARSNGTIVAGGFRWSFTEDSILDDVQESKIGKHPNSRKNLSMARNRVKGELNKNKGI